MIKIYHNPRCRKSREGVQFLEDKNLPFEKVEYLKTPFTHNELASVIDRLNIKPIDLIRKGEKDWKENFKGKDLNDTQVIDAMIQYPKLIERPIVVKNSKAIIARPAEKINGIL